MDEQKLEKKLFHELLLFGPQDACQLSSNMGFPLSASDDYDNRFFGALSNLEQQGLIHSRPISSEIPEANDSDPYSGKVYCPGDGLPLRELFIEFYQRIVSKVKQYF